MRKAPVAAMLALVFLSMPLRAQARSDFAEALTTAVPKLAMLRTADPAAFDRIVRIYEEGSRSGKSRDELISLARASFSEEHARRLARAPDDLILKAFDSSLGVIRDLQTRSVERCAALLTGGNAGDVKPFLSPATVASEDAVYEAILTFRSVPFSPAATAQEEQAFLKQAITAEAAASHEAFEPYVRRMFASPDTNCSLQHALMERMRKAPNAVALFRRRMAAGPSE